MKFFIVPLKAPLKKFPISWGSKGHGILVLSQKGHQRHKQMIREESRSKIRIFKGADAVSKYSASQLTAIFHVEALRLLKSDETLWWSFSTRLVHNRARKNFPSESIGKSMKLIFYDFHSKRFQPQFQSPFGFLYINKQMLHSVHGLIKWGIRTGVWVKNWSVTRRVFVFARKKAKQKPGKRMQREQKVQFSTLIPIATEKNSISNILDTITGYLSLRTFLLRRG